MTMLPVDYSLKDELEPYKTSDTPYAAFLQYNGMILLTTRPDPNDYKRKVYVFIYDGQIPKLEQEYRYANPQVDLKRYYKSYKTVTRYLRENAEDLKK